MTKAVSLIRVRRKPGHLSRGILTVGPQAIPVALGRGGIKANKFEGDGATPRGVFRPVRLWYRPDRVLRPFSALPIRRIGPDDGWCETPHDRRYNRPVKLDADSGADRLWRADRLYDLIVEIDHNLRPRIARRGSAVFLHLCREGMTPSAGCVTFPPARLRQVVPKLSKQTRIDIAVW
jgi:L,D-peptidoglycan transpeptidase YkuD (ErfK/YbiS/YcfS/YnhG family)